MKKFTAIVLAALMMLTMFAGCGKSANDDKYGLVTPGKLTVALSPDFAPMEFVDTNGNFVGFDVLLAKFIAEEMGLELVISPMSFDACQTAVAMGSVDMAISGFSWTEERAANYNLSDYYHAGDNEDEQVLITLKGNEGKYDTVEKLAGVKVGAQVASLQESLCGEQLTESTIVTISDLNTGLLQMRNGDFAVMAVAKGNGEAMIANNPDVIFAGFNFEVDEKYTGNVIMLKKGADLLTETVNGILAKAEAAGYYVTWYAEAQATAGVDVSYDDQGKVIE